MPQIKICLCRCIHIYVYIHTHRGVYILYNCVCVYVYMYIDTFLYNKWTCSFSLKRGNFSTENLDKTETLLSDHHFRQDTRQFLFGVVVFNQTLLPGRVVAHAAVPATHPGDSLRPGEPQRYTIPCTTKTYCVCATACLEGWLVLPIWGSTTGKVQVGGLYQRWALRLCSWLEEGGQLCPLSSQVARVYFWV